MQQRLGSLDKDYMNVLWCPSVLATPPATTPVREDEIIANRRIVIVNPDLTYRRMDAAPLETAPNPSCGHEYSAAPWDERWW